MNSHSNSNGGTIDFQTSESSGYSWREDIKKLKLLSSYEREIWEYRIEEWDLIVGEPSNGDSENYIGLYNHLLPELEIDETLMPENAESRGYIWVGEVQYDRDAPRIAMQGIIDDVREGYKLGMPASSNTDLQGLYAPLEEK